MKIKFLGVLAAFGSKLPELYRGGRAVPDQLNLLAAAPRRRPSDRCARDAGSYDQSTIEMRNDVLVYSSAPLGEGIEVSGFLEVVLYVSSDAKDTDFTAKLVDVYPDGRAFNLQEGAQRMRFRESLRRKVWMEEGEVYEIHLDLHATSNYFGKGHRIRLEVSSSNFPRWSRNLNMGGNNYDESAGILANNTVHHSPEYPSRVILPVVAQRHISSLTADE